MAAIPASRFLVGAPCRDLGRLLAPRSVALVGASDRSSWSVNIFQNLRRYSPAVEVFCVSPTRSTVHGAAAVPSLTALGRGVDLAYLMAPREAIPDLLREAAATGTRAAVVLTAGFGESDDGRGLQQELVRAARETGVELLGPNVSGLINVTGAIVPFGLAVPDLPHAGGASFVLQSGGLMKPVLGLARSWGVGVGMVVGTGNEAALTATDVARHLIESGSARAVGLFVEGIREPDAFRALMQRARELDRPVVVLPVGRSEVARRSAMSHTGSLAGDAAVTSAVLKRLGAIEVSSIEELVATTGLLARGVRPRGKRMLVIAASGGACDLVADRSAREELTLPELPALALDALKKLLPGFASIQNPLDVTGVATTDALLPVRAIDIAGSTTSGAYDVVLFQAFVSPPGIPANPDATKAHFKAIAEAIRAIHVPTLLVDEVCSGLSDYARELFHDLDLVRLPGIEIGLSALAKAADYARIRAQEAAAQRPAAAPRDALEALPREAISEAAMLARLRAAGVPVVPHRLVPSARSAVDAAKALAGSVVLKICSPDIPHKSDVGGVILDVTGDEAVAAAYEKLVSSVCRRCPDARIEGVLVVPFRPAGLELICGIKQDPVWGPVMLLGIGGVLVEVLKDVSIRPLPLRPQDPVEMLSELRGAALLRGVRGRPGADLEAVSTAVHAIAAAALAWGEAWESIEINPLRVEGSVVEALDALVTLR